MKLLLIDDNPDFYKKFLQHAKQEGHLVESAKSYKEGIKKITGHEYDFVVIKEQLPNGEGIKLLRMMGNNGSEAGVLLTATRDDLPSRLLGLKEGADDYLVHPFAITELFARINAILRRKAYRGGKKLIFDQLAIDIDARLVHVGNKSVLLTKKEFEILLFLARNKNRVLTKHSIADHLWSDDSEQPSYDFLYAHIKNLRQKLEKAGCPNYLKTEYGVGYRFVSIGG